MRRDLDPRELSQPRENVPNIHSHEPLPVTGNKQGSNRRHSYIPAVNKCRQAQQAPVFDARHLELDGFRDVLLIVKEIEKRPDGAA
jgi:hypothetical protein